MKKIIVCLLLVLVFIGLISCASGERYSSYEKIIDAYTELLEAKNNGEDLPTPKFSDEIHLAVYNVVMIDELPTNMGYSTKDINGDNVDELVLMSKNNRIYALFTMQNKVPVLLLNDPKSLIAISENGEIYHSHYKKDEYSYTCIDRIVDGKLDGIEYGSVADSNTTEPVYYKTENGVRAEITFQELNYLNESNRQINTSRTNKRTGFRFIPALTDNSVISDAPIADFSSYEAILSAYKTIVESFSQYTEKKWTDNEFDSLFNFTDNESYDIFNSIYYRGIQVMPTESHYGREFDKDGQKAYGYAEKDLNDDGINELVLLNDNYYIIAIFTQKNGKAVHIKGISYPWIDENGFIRDENSTGGVVGRDGEQFLYEIKDGELNCVLGYGYKVNVYLEKEDWYKIENGNRVPITDEEGKVMYERFNVTNSDYNQYTRTFSGLEFVPLTEKATVDEKYVKQFLKSYGSSQKITVLDINNGRVKFEFDCVYVVREDSFEITETIITPICATAIKEGDVYRFDGEDVKGYLDFCVNGIWVVITESSNERVEPYAYLLNY